MKSEGAQRYISMEYQVLLQLQGRCVSSCSNCADVLPADFDRGRVHMPHTVDEVIIEQEVVLPCP
jgi:hypothetical protein